MGDAGSVRIRAVLETPSTALAKALENLQTGLGAAEGLEAQVPASTGTAIERLRSIYATMKQEIESIDSGNSIKAEALAALAKMDIGLEKLQSGISQPPSDETERALAMAVRRLEGAGAGIEQAIARLR